MIRAFVIKVVGVYKKHSKMSVGSGSFVFLFSMSLLNHLKDFRQARSAAEKIPL